MLTRNNPKRLRIAIIDPDAGTANTIALVIDSTDVGFVIGSYRDFESAYKHLHHDQPDIVICDFTNKAADVSHLFKVRKLSHAAILIYTLVDETEMVFKALEAGLSGYLIKGSTTFVELIEGLQRIGRGGVAFSEPIAKMIVNSFYRNVEAPLSSREMQVLDLVSKGNTCAEIADSLFISKFTAKTHMRNIYKALNVTSKSEAIKVAGAMRLL